LDIFFALSDKGKLIVDLQKIKNLSQKFKFLRNFPEKRKWKNLLNS